MDTPFANAYEDDKRARAYADLGFPGSYWLAFRDIPALIRKHVTGTSALDFGCGAGRSTRFLKELGYQATGADISEAMLRGARERDPEGEYLLVGDGDLSALGDRRFDLVFSAFTFDNVPAPATRARLFAQFRKLLAPGGRMVNLVSAPEIYVNEWTSFSTKDFPENRSAGSGDHVRIRMLVGPDQRPVDDAIWFDEDYRALYRDAGLDLLETHRPLGRPDDPYDWVTENDVSPWTIYVLGAGGG